MFARYAYPGFLHCTYRYAEPNFHWKACHLLYAYCNFATKKKFKSSSNGKGTKNSGVNILRNEEIRYPSVRVVFQNEKTAKSEWEVMPRSKALAFAKELKLDLVLVNGTSDPPVCKLEDYGQLVQEARKKQKDAKAKQKARVLKEMFLTSGIESRDMHIKMNKVKQFIDSGHTVKVSIVAKKFTRANRFKNGVRRDRMAGFDETILMLLEIIEDWPIVVQEQKVKQPSAPPTPSSTNTTTNTSATAAEEKGDDHNDDDDSTDSEDEGEGEQEGEEAGATKAFYRPVSRREFLLTPKSKN